MKSIKNKITPCLFIIFFTFFFQNLIAQNKLYELIRYGEYDKAEKYCSKKRGSKQADCFYKMAERCYSWGEYEAAIEAYKKIGNKESYEKIANIYLKTKNLIEAEEYFIKAGLEKYGYEKIAIKYRELNNLNMATEFFEKAGKQTFTDERDGKLYMCVTIGDQTWMAENLFAEEFANGNGRIAYIDDTEKWSALGDNNTDKAYSSETGDENYVYTWAAATNGIGKQVIRKAELSFEEKNGTKLLKSISVASYDSTVLQGVCPAGWHLPDNVEWTELFEYLGGIDVAGGKMKDTLLWASPNIGATNESGFNAVPKAIKHCENQYYDNILFDWFGMESISYWWSASELKANSPNAYVVYLSNESGSAQIYEVNKSSGIAVRCIKN